jgi:hypothetical protein
MGVVPGKACRATREKYGRKNVQKKDKNLLTATPFSAIMAAHTVTHTTYKPKDMRTKALLGLAALAAGIATSVAQSNVYSLNIVGYVNYTQEAGKFKLVANPLNVTAGNDVKNVFADTATRGEWGTTVYKRNSGGGYDQSSYNSDVGDWDAGLDCSPGVGLWVYSAGTTGVDPNYTNTFVGEVQLDSTNALINGFSLFGSVVPQVALFQTDMGLPADFGDTIYDLNSGGGYDQYSLNPDVGDWDPSQPLNTVARGYWFYNSTGSDKDWIRHFTP